MFIFNSHGLLNVSGLERREAFSPLFFFFNHLVHGLQNFCLHTPTNKKIFEHAALMYVYVTYKLYTCTAVLIATL